MNVDVDVEEDVGLPLITPDDEIDSPAGSEPLASDQVKGDVPPLTANVCEYEVPLDASGQSRRGDIGRRVHRKSQRLGVGHTVRVRHLGDEGGS